MTTVKVRFSDLDPYGHVNHSLYLTYFELGRAHYLEERNLNLQQLLAVGVQLVVVDAAVKYRAPITQGEVTVRSEVSGMRGASMIWSQSLTFEGKVAATAEIRIASVGLDGKPIPIPEQLKV